MIALNSPLKPNLTKLNKYLEKINSNGWYTNFGPLHNELTSKLEDYLGVKNLLLVTNGTLALQVAAKTLGVKALISTPFSFVATVSAFMWQKNIVAFSDIDRNSYNLCPMAVREEFENGAKEDAIVATHVFGNPCDVENFEKIARKYNKKLIYDAAHAFGVKIGDNSVLNYGDASTLSFHATKIFHTIEGGAVVFSKNDDYEKAKELINFGINRNNRIVGEGINAKLNEYQAAVGLVNLEEMDTALEHRANLFHAYREGVKDIVEVPTWHPEAKYNGAYMPIKLKNNKHLANVEKSLSEKGIQTRRYFSPSLEEVFMNNNSYGTQNSKIVSEGVLCLPLHADMTISDVNSVIKALKSNRD